MAELKDCKSYAKNDFMNKIKPYDVNKKPTLTEVALSAAAICARNEAALCEIFPYG